LEWVAVEAVKSIAFVFQIDSINSGRYLCSGMENAYFVRNQKDEFGKLESIAEAAWVPFKNCFTRVSETYSKQIWNGIVATIEECWKAMSTKGNWDGRNKHVHMHGMNQELFQYISQSIESPLIRKLFVKSFKFGRAKKRLNPDLSVSNKRRTNWNQ
jgi:hypothetical protein